MHGTNKLVESAQADAKQTREDLITHVFELKTQLIRLKDRVHSSLQRAVLKLARAWNVPGIAAERDELLILQGISRTFQENLAFKPKFNLSREHIQQAALNYPTNPCGTHALDTLEVDSHCKDSISNSHARCQSLFDQFRQEEILKAELEQENLSLRELQKIAQDQEDKVQMVNLELLRISEMEQQLENYRHELDEELHERKKKHQQHQQFLKRRQMCLAKVEAEKYELTQKIRRTRQRLHGYQQNVKLKKKQENDVQGTHAKAVLDSIESQLVQVKELASKTQSLIHERDQQIQRMKIERKKLTKPAAETLFKKPTASEARKQANRHPYLIQIFRIKLQNKEKEKAALSKKIKRLMIEKHEYLTSASEHKHEIALSTQLQLGFRSETTYIA